MKKVTLILALLGATVVANAQFSKGSTFAGGSISYQSKKQDLYKESSITLSPSVGHFVTNNIAVGASLSIGSASSEWDGTKDTDSSSFSFGAFGRYYFTPSNKFSLFGHAGINFGTETEKMSDPDLKTKTFRIHVAPGVSYFLSNHLAIEATYGALSYGSRKLDVDGAKAENTFDLNLDLSSIGFGLIYKF